MTKVDLRGIKRLLQGVPPTPNLRKYLTHNPLKRKLIEGFILKLLSHVRRVRPETVIDVGCGEGIILHYVNKQYPRIELIGIDSSVEALSIARRLNKDASLILADARNLPLKKADMALAIELLEHLEDPKPVIDELSRLVDYTLISVPHTTLFRMANLLSLKHVRSFGENPNHKVAYDPAGLRRLLAPLDLCVLERAGVWLLALARTGRSLT